MTLTQYGRALSREAISTWGEEGEEDFLWGATRNVQPKWLQLGADLRTSFVERIAKPGLGVGRTTVADMEAIIGDDKTRSVVDVGFRELQNGKNPFGDPTYEYKPFSRRHYLERYVTDEFSVRAGRFHANFGLWNGDPANSVRAGLGWGDASETYNLEANYIGEEWNASVTGVLGRLNEPSNLQEKGLVATVSRGFKQTYKVGLGAFHRESDALNRTAFGEFMILGFTPRSYLLTEAYLQSQRNNGLGTSTLGFNTFNRVGFEVLLRRAFFILFTNDMSMSNFGNGKSLRDSYSVGLQWMPRPHLEFQAHYRKSRDASVSNAFGDSMIFSFHLYQ